MSAVISKFLATGSPTPYATRLCKKDLYCFGTFKNASNMTITLLTATEKMIVFPRASKQTKICASGKKKWESLLICLDVPHFCIISQNAQILSLFYPENGQWAPLPWIQALTMPTICTILMQKKVEGTVICFLVIVAHNVCELMCYI